MSSSSSSLLALLQQWIQSENNRNTSLHSLQQQERQDYEQMLKLVHEYQHTMAEYQNNMSTYLLLLASLQLRSFSAANPETPVSSGGDTFFSDFLPPRSQSQTQPQSQNSQRNTPSTSRMSNRRAGNRSYSTAAASSAIRPLITRLRDTVNSRMATDSSTSPFVSQTHPLIPSTTPIPMSTSSEDISGNLRSVSGSSTTSSSTTHPWYTLFPPAQSNAVNTSLQGLGLGSVNTATNRTHERSSSPVNLIDIVFEYDEPLSEFNNSEGESSLQRMVQNDDFRNQILRAAGLENRNHVMRWIVAPPHGLDEMEPRGMTNEQIRACTTNLVYSEGMEGLLSHVCPITMEEFTEGDRLLQLRECRHTFRERELVEWFQRHNTCPVCRRMVVE